MIFNNIFYLVTICIFLCLTKSINGNTNQIIPHACWHTNVSFSGLDDALSMLVKNELIHGMSYGFNVSEKFIKLNRIYPNLVQKNKLQNTQIKISFDIDIPLSGIYQIFALESVGLYNLLLKIIMENYMSGKLENYINQLIQKLNILNLSGISVAELTSSPMALVQLENIITGTISEVPSNSPSGIPTSSPTVEPSDVPTFSPSYLPFSSRPSSSPTVEPSTTRPTCSPSYLPSSSNPSFNPTVEPSTTRPTLRPSFVPSNLPTQNPTTKPTMIPSFAPSTTRPTLNPTIYSLMPVISYINQINFSSEIPSLKSILSELPSVYPIEKSNNTNNNYEPKETNNEVDTLIIISSVLLFLLATITVTHYIRIKQQISNSEKTNNDNKKQDKIIKINSIVPDL